MLSSLFYIDLKNWIIEAQNKRLNREIFDCVELRSKFNNFLNKRVIFISFLKQTNMCKSKLYKFMKNQTNYNELIEEQYQYIQNNKWVFFRH